MTTVRTNTKRNETARTAHVLPGSSHARADEWERCETCGLTYERDPFHFDCPANDPGEWGPLPSDAITAELVACTLGQRSRPELMMPEAKPRLSPDSRLWRIMDRIGLAVLRPDAFRVFKDTTA